MTLPLDHAGLLQGPDVGAGGVQVHPGGVCELGQRGPGRVLHMAQDPEADRVGYGVEASHFSTP